MKYRTLPSIHSNHWQPKLHSNDVAEGLEDIDQSIRIILLTPYGSDRHRPTFGSRIFDYIDAPINIVKPHLVREAIEAVRKWEKRIDVDKVNVIISVELIRLVVVYSINQKSYNSEVIYERTA